MKTRAAFTLVELIVVVAIISVLSAILFPAFLTVRGSARSTVCRSNLAQIARATSIYCQDYDDYFPYGIDHQDRYIPYAWISVPSFQAQIPSLPFAKDLLLPYTKSKNVFICPADTGYEIDDFYSEPIDAKPTSAEAFGSSYYYDTELVVNQSKIGLLKPSQSSILFFDSAGYWHGTLTPLEQRYNVAFVDGHVKNVSAGQLSAYRSPDIFPELQ